MSLVSSTVIEDIRAMCKAGNASMAYFYFDFREVRKQGLHDLLPSLLTQLSTSSDLRCNLLSRLYLDHNEGNKQPSVTNLSECLKEMLTLPDQRPIYLIIDALDELLRTTDTSSGADAKAVADWSAAHEGSIPLAARGGPPVAPPAPLVVWLPMRDYDGVPRFRAFYRGEQCIVVQLPSGCTTDGSQPSTCGQPANPRHREVVGRPGAGRLGRPGGGPDESG